MNTNIESLAWWKVHMAAADEAKRKGACWLCASEAGCRATDAPGENRGREMHPAGLVRHLQAWLSTGSFSCEDPTSQ